MAELDIGLLLDQGRWTRVQKWFVFLVALTVIFDGIDNQLLGIALPTIAAGIMQAQHQEVSAFRIALEHGARPHGQAATDLDVREFVAPRSKRAIKDVRL